MYLDCNQSQTEYFQHEMDMFSIDSNEIPFDFKRYSNANVVYFPTSCINENVQIEYPYFTHVLADYYVKKFEQPLTTSTYLPSTLINSFTNYIWNFMGYTLETHSGELYWHYANKNTDNIVVFFHGINAMNGIENIYLLNQLKKNSSIYVSVYQTTFVTEYLYNHTYSQHINNVISFLNTKNGKDLTLIGNSYGSIRITTMCKRYNCSKINKIILTDPVNLNFPFSSLFKHVVHGVFVNTNYTKKYRKSTTVKVLRQTKQYYHIYNNLDWYEWSLDTIFMEHYKHNLILVIGNYDALLTVNSHSKALTEICRVIYTNTSHGLVLFTDFLKYIELDSSCSV